MSQSIQQIFEPLRVATGFKTDQCRQTQLTVKALGFAVAILQLQLADLSRF
jgi:hypothetical protein